MKKQSRTWAGLSLFIRLNNLWESCTFQCCSTLMNACSSSNFFHHSNQAFFFLVHYSLIYLFTVHGSFLPFWRQTIFVTAPLEHRGYWFFFTNCRPEDLREIEHKRHMYNVLMYEVLNCPVTSFLPTSLIICATLSHILSILGYL
jgi:hypothetical protein